MNQALEVRNHVKIGLIELRETVMKTGHIKFSMIPSGINPKSLWAEPYFYMKHEATDITSLNHVIANFINTHGDDNKGYGVFFYIYKEEQ